MNKHSSFIFTIDGRTYKGTRLRPREGFSLGISFTKLVSAMFSKAEDDINLGKVLKEATSANEKDLDFIVNFIANCITSLDEVMYNELFYKTLKPCMVEARKEADTKTVLLSNDKEFDEWFTEFPQDLAEFSARLLWENASPFLPGKLKSLFQNT